MQPDCRRSCGSNQLRRLLVRAGRPPVDPRDLGLDPSVLFLLSCLLAPPLLELCTGGEQFTLKRAMDYVIHPVPMTSLACALAFLGWVHRDAPCVTSSERMVAAWYLVNGFGFKTAMDVMSGSMQSWNLMTDQYNALEKRYAMSMDHHPEAAAVHLCSLLEAVVQAPLCIWLYLLIIRRGGSATRFAVEVSLATLQAAGTWFFYLPLVFTSSKQHVLALFASEDLVIDVLFRGVFGSLICPMIWIVVPIARIYCVTKHFDRVLSSSSQHR